MARKPTLVLHPGFPKCATSSIQHSFVVDNHALARHAGVQFLGKQFKPNNGYPEVIRLMDSPESCIAEMRAMNYPSQDRYFLSNEAVAGKGAFWEVLQERFKVEKTIFTIRLPALQALSNYCYSGWYSSSFQEASQSPATGLQTAQARLEKKLEQFSRAGAPVQLCPLEDSPEGITTKFCKLAFGLRLVPQTADRPLKANKSIGFAFASALHSALQEQTNNQKSQSFRRRLIKEAQAYPLDQELKDLTSADLTDQIADSRDKLCTSYEHLLIHYGLTKDEAYRASHAAAEKLHQVISAPVATIRQMESLKEHAKILLKKMLSSS